jgi:hypothetical protein
MDSAQFHVDDKLLGCIKRPPVDAELSFLFDPARYRGPNSARHLHRRLT